MGAKRSTAGQPPTDIALRLRNWIWYWQVKRAKNLSDDQLDQAYLPSSASGVRQRYFHRVRSLGSDPSLPRDDLDGQSVFDRVHHGGALERERSDFISPLWRMLSDPYMTIDAYQKVIDTVICDRGWYRASDADRELGQRFIPDEPALGCGDDSEHVYSSMLTSLESAPSADNVALLAALFREALWEIELSHAALLRESFGICNFQWLMSLPEPSMHHVRLLWRLLDERLVRNKWRVPHIPKEASKSQRSYVSALLQAFTDDSQWRGRGRSTAPIVLRSERTKWLQDNCAYLSEISDKIEMEKDQYWRLRNSTRQTIRQVIEDIDVQPQRELEWERIESALRQNINPPPRTTKHCLPVRSGEGSRVIGRPAPYTVEGVLDECRPKDTLRFIKPEDLDKKIADFISEEEAEPRSSHIQDAWDDQPV